MSMAARDTRLDLYLVERGLFPTRARARDAILRGTVEVDGIGVSKPSRQVAAGTVIVMASVIGAPWALSSRPRMTPDRWKARWRL